MAELDPFNAKCMMDSFRDFISILHVGKILKNALSEFFQVIDGGEQNEFKRGGIYDTSTQVQEVRRNLNFPAGHQGWLWTLLP